MPELSGHSDAATAETQQQEDANAQQEASWSRLEHGIAIADGNDAPHVIQSFEKMGLPSSVLSVLHSRGITTPTAIQMQAIPSVLSGRDVIGLASTGSGKSLCFILPLLVLLSQQAQQQQSSHSHFTAALHFPLQDTQNANNVRASPP